MFVQKVDVRGKSRHSITEGAPWNKNGAITFIFAGRERESAYEMARFMAGRLRRATSGSPVLTVITNDWHKTLLM